MQTQASSQQACTVPKQTSHQQHTHTRLETIPKELLTPFHLKKHRKAFLLGKKITKRQNGTWVSTASSMGHLWIVGTSWPKCWHHCHQREARSRRLDPVEVWRIKLSPKDCRPWNEKTARPWKVVVGKLLLIFGPCLFSGAMWVFGEGNPFWEIHFC